MAKISVLKGEDHRPGIIVASSYGTKVKQITEKEWHYKLVRSNMFVDKMIRG